MCILDIMDIMNTCVLISCVLKKVFYNSNLISGEYYRETKTWDLGTILHKIENHWILFYHKVQ